MDLLVKIANAGPNSNAEAKESRIQDRKTLKQLQVNF